MAVAVLSPWPTTPAAITAAVACLRAAQVAGNDEAVAALGAAASALVERHAPDAPQAIRNEACLRCAAYLSARRPTAFTSLQVASIQLNYRADVRGSPDALRLSGARQLLSPWRVRRALRVTEAAS